MSVVGGQMAHQLSRPLQLATWTLVVCMCSAVSLAAAAALERPQGAAGHSSRIAVMFDEEHKLQIKQQLLDKGYKILTEGSGFFAVGTPVPASSRPPATSPAATAGRRLTQQGKLKERQQQQQQQQQRHVQHIERIPGVISSEPDVRRFLHIRPSFLGGQQHPPGQHPAAGAATAAGRRLATTDDAAAGSGSSRTQSPRASSGHLKGHWHQGSNFRPGPYDIWGKDISDPRCAALDMPLSEAPGGEVVPWGIKRIGAWNDTLQSLPAKGRAIVCIIDSGLWKQHPEYASSGTTRSGSSSSSGAKVDVINGCTTSADCPFTWSEDIVGHGTHVAGTIAAPRNGLGVVGVMYSGAELHVVRIWNESGDVSQGQGPYATDLVLAYDNCLNHLEAEQNKSSSSSGGREKVNMVINMSYGSAGPLTVERLWVQRAAARGDVLFVASAGNNGSFLLDPALFGSPDQGPGKPRLDPGQSLSYPASYNLPEVLSVANARCDDTIDFTSQKNKAVSIAAPGMAILSSVPKQYGAVRAAIATSSALPNQTAPAFSSTGGQQATQGAYSLPPFGSGGRAAPGRGPGPTIVRKGIGYLSNGYLEPRPVQGTQLGSTGMRPLVACNITGDVRAAAFSRSGQPPPGQSETCPGAAGAVCLIELPGNIDWYMETCLAMLKCTRSGGKGLMLWRSDKLLSGLFSDPDPLDSEAYEPDETLLGTQINCGTKCGCWQLLKQQLRCEDGDCASKAPPAIVVSAKHAAAMLDASKAAAAAAAGAAKAGGKSKQSGGGASSSSSGSGGGLFMVDVTNYQYNYRHFDGTSMAAPHVSGAAALLWRLAPNCKARDIADALKQSAAKLTKQQAPASGPDLAAGSGLVRVDRAVDWIMQNKDCAKS